MVINGFSFFPIRFFFLRFISFFELNLATSDQNLILITVLITSFILNLLSPIYKADSHLFTLKLHLSFITHLFSFIAIFNFLHLKEILLLEFITSLGSYSFELFHYRFLSNSNLLIMAFYLNENEKYFSRFYFIF